MWRVAWPVFPYVNIAETQCYFSSEMGPSGVWGIWGEWLFIFRELGCTGNYFRGTREQAHNFGDLGSLAKMQKIKEKSPFCLIFL